MKLLLSLFILSLLSCKNSTKKTNQAMDDTARTRNSQTGSGLSPIKITEAEIPSAVKFEGKVVETWKWTDNHGENFLVTTHVAPYDDKQQSPDGEEGQTSELRAYHYATKKKGLYEVWNLNDMVKSCPFDITSNFIPGATTITDIDKNGVAEIKLQYFKACRSDVSPAEHILVLFENGIRYSLKGLSWLAYSPELKFDVTVDNANLEKLGKTNIDNDEDYVKAFGRYENEKEFASAPPGFIDYARTEWVKFVKEKIGE